MGPDFDKNYSYKGFLYIVAYLELKYGDQRHLDAISDAKLTLTKMFRMGKLSKSKPGPLLEKSRTLYEELAKELEEFDAE